jgi:hypothetical protein
MTDPRPSSAPLRGTRRQLCFVAALMLAVVAIALAGVAIVRHRDAPSALPEVSAPAAAEPTTQDKPSGTKPKSRRAAAVPELVPGSKLDDDHFAQISAEVVIAAMGLKRDKDWETNVLLYMQKTLDKAGLSVEEYNKYARALYDNPDRGRAVAENIMMRVEKKIGYRVSMDKLPMFKFDEKTVKELQKKLEK